MTSTSAAQVQHQQQHTVAAKQLAAGSLPAKDDGTKTLPSVPPVSTFRHLDCQLQEITTEAEEDKDAQESSLYKEDSFRMYCMKVASPSL